MRPIFLALNRFNHYQRKDERMKVFVIAEGGRTPTQKTLTRLKESEFKDEEVDIYAGYIYNKPGYLAEQLDRDSVIAYVNAEQFFELFGGDYIVDFTNALLAASQEATSYDVCAKFVRNLATIA